ncbi:hypothetical protein GL2_21270 [Microbulbifer sp. GL-2]|nr:hypothetical protein GL2_21270 [Microbulbifer sp. GL-2]
MRETEEFYFFWKHQFGQWTLRDMIDPDGIVYNCCEQYMMYKKALLFGDKYTAKNIMEESEPSIQQKLGREVSGYNSELWNMHKFGIVWYGNYLKFTQHADLGERLIETGQKTIAEASPYDLVWGVGYAADTKEILNPNMWRGKNLLGQVLMSVRSAISKN